MITLTPGTLFANGKYRIERRLGSGAFGTVYEVENLRLNRREAMKVLDAPGATTLAAQARERFGREAELAAHVRHPNVINVYDHDDHDGTIFMTMTLAHGGSLADYVRSVHPVPIAEAVRLLREAAAGLQALHDADAIHRDVKPSNLLLTADRHVLVADLGLAQVSDGLSQRSVLVSAAGHHPGTPDYMSPEHADPRSMRPTSDVYSLGCVAFELLTGQPWITAQSRVDRPSSLRGDVPKWLDDIVMRMLVEAPGMRAAEADDAAKRYVRMEQIVAALDAGGGTSADVTQRRPPESTAPKPKAPVTRPRVTTLGAAIGGLLAVALIFGLGVSLIAGRTAPAARSPTGTPTIQSLFAPGATEAPATNPTPRTQTGADTADATPTPTPTATPTPTPTPMSTSTSTSTATAAPTLPQPEAQTTCPVANAYPKLGDAILKQLGCATAAKEAWQGYYQKFEQGWMLLSGDQDNNQKRKILAFANDGRVWQVYYDPEFVPRMNDNTNKNAWYWPCAIAIKPNETQPPEYSGLPWRGFGRVWCDYAAIKTALGNVPLGEGQEKSAQAQSQAFENGRVIGFGSRTYVMIFTGKERSQPVDEGARSWMRAGRWK